jgi:hypothetical protein
MKRISMLAVVLAFSVFVFPNAARAQFFVDCSNPAAQYPTINSALPFAGPAAFIAVTGTCNENVFLFQAQSFTLGAAYGAATLNGSLSFYGSQNVFVYGLTINGNLSVNNSGNVYLLGLNVTNAFGDGIDVNNSHSVTLDSSTSNGNAGNGLTAGQSCDVTINAFGAFSNNGGDGIFAGNSSLVNIVSWAGTTEISNNQNSAVAVFSGNFATNGNTHIANNAVTPAPGLRVAIDMRGAGKAQIGSVFGPNIIESNPNGAISLQENAEISLWSITSSAPNIVRNNGPFGIQAGFGSQVTLAGTQMTGHTGPALDIYAHSQVYATSQIPGLNATQVQNNATAGGSLNAAIRLDGNSEALLRGVDVSQNHGPAILALVNSSADFSGSTFTGDAGVISCDSTSTMVSDLALTARIPAAGVSCTTAHSLGNRVVSVPAPAVPDVSIWKKVHGDYQKRSTTPK